MSVKTKKHLLFVLLILLLGLSLYWLLFPVRTLGEVLEKKEIFIFTDSYDRKDYEKTYIIPETLPGLQQDVLGLQEASPMDSDVRFDFSSPKDKDNLCQILSSLKVRKKLGKYHGFSKEHLIENGYEYRIKFSWNRNLRITLCQKEVCFQTSSFERYGSFRFNAYCLVDCPENQALLDQLLALLMEKEEARIG